MNKTQEEANMYAAKIASRAARHTSNGIIFFFSSSSLFNLRLFLDY
jgi:hypothetical protein